MNEETKLILAKLEEMQTELREVKEDLQETKETVKEIKLTIENEIDKKINIIAEGHIDLSRNLHKVLAIEAEKENMVLRLISLEGDVRRLTAGKNKTA